MRLYAKEKPVTVSSIESDGYHCCRWCHWYDHKTEKCINPVYVGEEANSSFVTKVIEEGHLSDALNEGLHNVPDKEKAFLGTLTTILYVWGVSAKRIEAFKTAFGQALEQYLDMGLKGELDEFLSKMLYNRADDFSSGEFEGIEIKDPETHYCREFW